VRRKSSEEKKEKRKADPNARPLDVLVCLCSFEGLFELNEDFAEAIGVDLAKLKAATPAGVTETVWATIL
jgi:hypothetical protein